VRAQLKSLSVDRALQGCAKAWSARRDQKKSKHTSRWRRVPGVWLGFLTPGGFIKSCFA
jgi:hypothetical protein